MTMETATISTGANERKKKKGMNRTRPMFSNAGQKHTQIHNGVDHAGPTYFEAPAKRNENNSSK